MHTDDIIKMPRVRNTHKLNFRVEKVQPRNKNFQVLLVIK